LALQTLKVDTKNGSFLAESFNKALAQIDCKHVLGIAIGAGFEAATELLDALPVVSIFNLPSVIQAVKNPTTFFDFLASIGAPHPVTQLSRPSSSIGWLQKQIGGSGGAHIKAALPLDLPENIAVYYQQQCAGEPHGCLFLADGYHAQIIGFHQQWCAATPTPSPTQPYRFSGAVSHVELPAKIIELIESYIQKITQKFGLRGINNLDFLLHNNELNILEVNPRLSASMQLYSAKKGNLFAAHVQACLGQSIDWPIVDKTSCAIQIVYSNKTAHVPAEIDWPEWVCDIPQPNSEIAAGTPFCSVMADARTAKLARKKLMQRVALL
jgi:uncharacterized protein